jgi:oxalate---CoA ligase
MSAQGPAGPTWYSAGSALRTAVLDKAQSLENAQAAHFVVSGGAPLPKDVQDGLQRILSVPVLEHFGSSEAAQIAANQPPLGPNRPGTCGQPWPDTVSLLVRMDIRYQPGSGVRFWFVAPP